VGLKDIADMRSTNRTQLKLRELTRILEGKIQLLIVMQDNPDPDSIAAAVALRKLANVMTGIQCSITHGGRVGRAENRALVRYLNLNLRPIEDIQFDKFDLTAMVDTQPGVGNNSLPPDVMPDIVIDHHPYQMTTRRAKFSDVRSRYGATATILLEYLRQAKIKPDIQLATALLYAIRSDTQDLGQQAVRADVEAIGMLYPLANKRMLSEIQRGRVQREYFTLLSYALQHAKIYGNAIITKLPNINIPDMVGEVADLLLRDDEAEWALCYGPFRQKILLSIRTSQRNKRAEEVIRSIVSRVGTGGGHEMIAGGQIPLTEETKTELERLEKLIRRRFLESVSANKHKGRRLVD
jgi:nanoRNase/pAp phosphatase (c-di-AMP/oligoRNAs hydrolase)